MENSLKNILEIYDRGDYGSALFLHAPDIILPPAIDAHYYYKPSFDHKELSPHPSQYDCILVRATQNKTEQLGLLAWAVSLEPKTIIICQDNNAGAKSLATTIENIFLQVESFSKNKCRNFIIDLSGGYNHKTIKEWREAAKPHFVQEIDYHSEAGIFGWNKIDAGSKILIEHIFGNDLILSGHGADFGCGYGYLSHQVLSDHKHDINEMHLIDHDCRALNAAKQNIPGQNYIWANLALDFKLSHPLDFIIMNPPFHKGKETAIQLGQKFISNAYKNLKPGGHMLMVANNHLPYEKLLMDLFKKADILSETNNFKILYGIK